VSFRARLALVAAAAVALAVVLASAVVYVVVRNELRAQVDTSVRNQAREIGHAPVNVLPGPVLDVGRPVGGDTGFLQLVTADGQAILTREERGSLPVSDHVLAVAQGRDRAFMSDASVSGGSLRVLTIPVRDEDGRTYALLVAQPLSGVNHTLKRIALFLVLIALGGVAVAAGLGLAVSRAALRPVRRLTDTAEHVTETGDLSQRIEPGGHDELGRLATSFNTMLGALEDSSRAQRQLVADASHELRTPLTSLRTNIEVLAGEHALAPEERERLLHDVVEQLGEMTALIAELIELARAEQHPEEAQDIRLDLIAEDAVERARRNRPNVTFTTDFDSSLVHGAPSTIERAIANLLDNAAKWSPPGGPVEVGVHGHEVTVRDHGPGIAEEDLPYVFDRFYRASAARGLPGSGLGLAIVKQVAEAHGGTVVAERPEDGGTLMRLRLDGRRS
jgi:two-component system sensor histidine kinase MprB